MNLFYSQLFFLYRYHFKNNFELQVKFLKQKK